jgi:two-component system nitrogen regulation response regulator NtrX
MFREDLFFRLNVVPISVPSLRARRGDISALASHFLQELAYEYGHRVKALDASALTVLRAHDWPGNVRELRNVLERLAIMVPGDSIGAKDLGFLSGGGVSASNDGEPAAVPLQVARERFERDYIVRALAAQRGNISRAAESLRVERSNLYRKMRAFGIIAPRKGNQVDQRRTSLSDRRAPDPV